MAARAAHAEAEAWAEMQLALPEEFARRLGVRVRRLQGGLAIMAQHLDNLALNRVLGLGLERPFTRSLLDELVAEYRAAGVPRMLVQWCPLASPPEVPAWLSGAGFRTIPRIAKLWRAADASATAPCELEIRRIGRDDAETFATVAGQVERRDLAPGFCSTVGHDGWSHYLVFDENRAVAAAALRVRGDVGWLGLGATLVEARRRGAHGALLARRVQDAAAAGCRWVVCETTEETAARPNQSYRNMRRAGFEVLYMTENFVLDLASS
jgi:hypothetical protein